MAKNNRRNNLNEYTCSSSSRHDMRAIKWEDALIGERDMENTPSVTNVQTAK